MTDNTILSFCIAGETLVMDGRVDTAHPYKIFTLEGLSAADYEINIVKNGQGHGGRVSGKRVSDRQITVEAEYRGVGDIDTQEEFLIGYFNPFYTGVLTVEKGGFKRFIEFEVSSFISNRANYYDSLSFQAILTCPYPFFKDTDEYSENMAKKTGLIRAPFIIPQSGYITSVKEYKQEMRITNVGHKEAGIKIEIRAVGTVVNPRMDNLTTGQYIKVNHTMAAGDVLIINTNRGETNITLNGQSVTNKKDRGSRYFQMEKGDNVLKYGADDGYTYMNVYPRYRPEYLGV